MAATMPEPRIIVVGQWAADLGRWVLVSEGEHPLPASARKALEACWPELQPADITPEQAEQWFNDHFPPKRVDTGETDGSK